MPQRRHHLLHPAGSELAPAHMGPARPRGLRLACGDAGETARVLARWKHGRTVSVVLPARNEEATVGAIVRSVREELMGATGLVDEIVVMDDRSSDTTAAAAEVAGARVVATNSVLPVFGTCRGKGDAMWRSLVVARGDVIVWCDADLRSFDPSIVVSLLAPILTVDGVHLVKGFYRRSGDDGAVGGRVTELMAKPLLAEVAPQLAHIREPLGGLIAATRWAMERIPMECDYGVDVAILADVHQLCGADAIAEVDLGLIHHRHREVGDLAMTSRHVIRAILARYDWPPTDAWAVRSRPPHRRMNQVVHRPASPVAGHAKSSVGPATR